MSASGMMEFLCLHISDIVIDIFHTLRVILAIFIGILSAVQFRLAKDT